MSHNIQSKSRTTTITTALRSIRVPKKQQQFQIIASNKLEREKVEMQMSGELMVDAGKPKLSPPVHSSTRQRKLALQQDVDKLKKKLTHEENVHKALERAFTRPLGSLPRLPPYLPPPTLELLAEVAVLEEEVVRLEEQVLQFRKGLYQEAISISSSKDSSLVPLCHLLPVNISQDNEPSLALPVAKSPTHADVVVDDDGNHGGTGRGKENQLTATDPSRIKQLSPPSQKTLSVPTAPTVTRSQQKCLQSPKMKQPHCRSLNLQSVKSISPPITPQDEDSPNTISENVLKCLISIFFRMGRPKSKSAAAQELSSFSFSSLTHQNFDYLQLSDPYGICTKFGKRDIGPYKKLCSVDARSINPARKENFMFLVRRLKILIAKLASTDVHGLSHQQKLAFWINVYNSCMMNAFLELGIPECPETVVALMQKATINVGGHQLNSITIEHFILRLPYHCKYTFSKGAKNDETTTRSRFGLYLSEPLVTFALSCGNWSSPTVRVYTAAEVENELEVAKREYLQAAIGISAQKKLMIPKLLDWYLLDFAKDLESLLDWICLQLPSQIRKDAMKCLQRGKNEPLSQLVEVIPHEYSFRYLIHTQVY